MCKRPVLVLLVCHSLVGVASKEAGGRGFIAEAKRLQDAVLLTPAVGRQYQLEGVTQSEVEESKAAAIAPMIRRHQQ